MTETMYWHGKERLVSDVEAACRRRMAVWDALPRVIREAALTDTDANSALAGHRAAERYLIAYTSGGLDAAIKEFNKAADRGDQLVAAHRLEHYGAPLVRRAPRIKLTRRTRREDPSDLSTRLLNEL